MAPINRGRVSDPAQAASSGSHKEAPGSAGGTLTLDKIISDMPDLVKSPVELNKRVSELQPGFYFFSTTAWESAMSSGALTHMRREELDRYVDAYVGVKNYQEYSRSMFPEYIAVETYFPSHHSYTPAEEAEGEQKLRTLQMGFQVMEHLSEEMKSGIEESTKER